MYRIRPTEGFGRMIAQTDVVDEVIRVMARERAKELEKKIFDDLTAAVTISEEEKTNEDYMYLLKEL